MGKPICKVYMGRPKPSWYRLTKQEQESLLAKVAEALNRVGGKSIVTCSSSWSNEKWGFFGLEEFPDMDAVQKHAELLEALHWPFEFAETQSVIGTKIP